MSTELKEKNSAVDNGCTYSLRRGEITNDTPVVDRIAVKPQKFLEMIGVKNYRIPKEQQPIDGHVQKWREIPLIRIIIMILSVALMIYAILPVFVGVFTVGTLPPLFIGAFFFLVARYWNCIAACNKWWCNGLCVVVSACVLIGILLMCYLSGLMLGASMNTLPEYKTRVTVVVLGCKINGDKPSRMLEDRLNAAGEYLLSNPQAYCIVTGGQGDDEDYPEAQIMYDYLRDMGVAETRLIAETQSTSTRENLENAAVLIDEYNCHRDIAIVSDRFHQYRARLIAQELGFEPFAINVETRWYLAMHYWFREMAGIARLRIAGY